MQVCWYAGMQVYEYAGIKVYQYAGVCMLKVELTRGAQLLHDIPANSKISNFTDLTTWQEAHRLVLLIYGITCNLPDREKYNIVNQLERAVVSITNNIAEGFGRHSNKEEVQFLYVSLGSLKEVQNMSIICKDLGYISDDQFLEINDQTSSVSRLLRGLIRSCQVN